MSGMPASLAACAATVIAAAFAFTLVGNPGLHEPDEGETDGGGDADRNSRALPHGLSDIVIKLVDFLPAKSVGKIGNGVTGLAGMEQVSLATVAPGIAESLVTTAVGLFAAIPAVVAYNFFARDIERITVAEESFIDEFSNILQRNAASRPAVQVPPASADTTAFAATR